MSFMEDFKKSAQKALQEANHAAAKARRTAGEATDANRSKIDAALDKAGRAVDARTDGKYADKVAKARSAAGKGVDFVAKQRTTEVPPRPGSATPPPAGGYNGGNASWPGPDVQDRMPGDPGRPGGTGPDNFPPPIPPYQPPSPR